VTLFGPDVVVSVPSFVMALRLEVSLLATIEAFLISVTADEMAVSGRSAAQAPRERPEAIVKSDRLILAACKRDSGSSK
jgi:hypothetical protein